MCAPAGSLETGWQTWRRSWKRWRFLDCGVFRVGKEEWNSVFLDLWCSVCWQNHWHLHRWMCNGKKAIVSLLQRHVAGRSNLFILWASLNTMFVIARLWNRRRALCTSVFSLAVNTWWVDSVVPHHEQTLPCDTCHFENYKRDAKSKWTSSLFVLFLYMTVFFLSSCLRLRLDLSCVSWN